MTHPAPGATSDTNVSARRQLDCPTGWERPGPEFPFDKPEA